MRKRPSLLALVLLITACIPALPKITESSKTPEIGLTVQTEASPTVEVEEQFDPSPPEPTETIPPSRLLPSSELQSYCLSWLSETPSPANGIRLQNGITEGAAAVDFILNDVHGETYRLSDLLETKPVLLVLGGYT